MEAVVRVLLPSSVLLLLHIFVGIVLSIMYPEGDVRRVSREDVALGGAVLLLIGLFFGLLMGGIIETINRNARFFARQYIVFPASLVYGLAYEYFALSLIGIV